MFDTANAQPKQRKRPGAPLPSDDLRLLQELVSVLGSRRAVAASIGISAPALRRALNGGCVYAGTVSLIREAAARLAEQQRKR